MMCKAGPRISRALIKEAQRQQNQQNQQQRQQQRQHQLNIVPFCCQDVQPACKQQQQKQQHHQQRRKYP
eukprot:4281575-Prorocentrum_lima.AAC.1